jgi:hypothetical protein
VPGWGPLLALVLLAVLVPVTGQAGGPAVNTPPGQQQLLSLLADLTQHR